MSALAVIGGVFVLKYAARLVDVRLAMLAAVVYVAVYVAVLGHLRLKRGQGGRWVAAGLVGLAIVVAAVAPEANGVARAPAIDEWLRALVSGAYPYGQPSRPSGLPGLFGLAFPFWLSGTVWLIPPAGLALLLATVWRVSDERLGAVFAVAMFVPAWYEMWTHSELVANGALALAAVLGAEALRRRGGAASLIVAALVVGVALSTRLSVGLFVAVYGAFVLRREPRWALVWGTLALAVCAATVVPFALWEPETFRALGPFSTQARFLPPWTSMPVVVAALALGWTATSLRAVVSRSGLLVVGLTALSFALALGAEGPAAFWQSYFDVTYFILGAPLLIAALPPWRGDETP